MTHVTPMELLTLFHKTDFSVINTTVYAHKLLSVLLTFVNRDVSQGYKAWPATDLLEKRTGMKKSSLTKYRKALQDCGLLLQIVPNAGPGRSCVYYINAQKIVDLAEQCEVSKSDRPVAKAVVPMVRKPHKRNTAGLKNQPVKPAPAYYEDEEEIEPPF